MRKHTLLHGDAIRHSGLDPESRMLLTILDSGLRRNDKFIGLIRISKGLKKSLFLMAIIALLLTLFAWSGFAEDSEVSRATLVGIPGLRVIVEEVQPNVQKYAAKFGLSGAQISRDVEQKLREIGIRVVEGNDWLAIPGRPALYVNINTHETEKYWYAYDIRLELRQLATLEANPQVKTLAGTWSLSITGLANIGNLNMIRQDAGVLVGRFVQAYRAVNKR